MAILCKNGIFFSGPIEGWELFNKVIDQACSIIVSLPQTRDSRILGNVVKEQLVTGLDPIIENMEQKGHSEDVAKMRRVRDDIVNLNF